MCYERAVTFSRRQQLLLLLLNGCLTILSIGRASVLLTEDANADNWRRSFDTNQHPIRHLDRFSRFSTAHASEQQTDDATTTTITTVRILCSAERCGLKSRNVLGNRVSVKSLNGPT